MVGRETRSELRAKASMPSAMVVVMPAVIVVVIVVMIMIMAIVVMLALAGRLSDDRRLAFDGFLCEYTLYNSGAHRSDHEPAAVPQRDDRALLPGSHYVAGRHRPVRSADGLHRFPIDKKIPSGSNYTARCASGKAQRKYWDKQHG